MRKYILSILLIIVGLAIISIGYLQQNNPTYAEAAFATQSKKFDLIFEEFTSEVKENVFTIKNKYPVTFFLKDSLEYRDYFLEILANSNAINSIGYFQGDHKFVLRKENTSYVMAVDSLSNSEIVKWERFEKGKKIGSWYESFEKSIYNSTWYQDLMSQNEQLTWYLRKSVNTDDTSKQIELFYVGYSYMVNNLKTTIVLAYSKDRLFQEFGFRSKNINPRLSFMNVDGKELHLNVNGKELHHNTNKTDQENDSLGAPSIDSLQISIANHFKNFKNVAQGSFNFKFKNEVYWNSFKRLSGENGIQYYLYTVPSIDLIPKTDTLFSDYSSWLAYVLIIIGLVILFIRKRFFYLPNRMKIPPVEELLKEDENRYLEFKSSLRWDYRQEKVNPELEKVIMKTIAAFGNTDGGILLLGVDDDKNILGLENDFQSLKKTDADYYEVHLRNIMHKLMGVKYVSKYIRTQFETLDDEKVICKIKVLSANEPLYIKYPNKNGQQEEKFYVRSGNSSHEIKSIREINDYINSKFK